ncbi:MAG: Pgm: phosphoglucomutase (Glucose phosphomutase) [candidate division TM6 bacterium GW2011_GWF2_37_49]|nr:MAG: Pgm: phosphoglucomutase (Glucose phosphomutase) [candidate division TM6 bacterium GW2011_GWF2_37_49]
MNSCIFREYDIRGLIGQELLLDECYDLGKALITYLVNKNSEANAIIIGRDGRSHSQQIFDQFSKASMDMGFDVIDLGLVPTPVAYFAVKTLKNPAMLMITASHNPKEYNGIKVWGASGPQIQEIRKIYESQDFCQAKKPTHGVVINKHEIINEYINYLTTEFTHLKNSPIKALIDSGNGAAGAVVPQLIQAMGWNNVKQIFAEIDGDFPNHEADPTTVENMQFAINELKSNPELEIGIGFDGDCDRMCPITKSGKLVSGDRLLTIFAKPVLQAHPNATIVFDIKSSSCLIEALTKWGANPLISPSGHSIIKDTMIKENAKLAGELSCHFFFNDRYFGYDDGIYAMMRLVEILTTENRSLDELLDEMPIKESTAEIKIKCATEADKKIIVDQVKTIFAARKDVQAITIDGIRAQMSYGWGLLRASNTQPALILRFESDSKEGLKQIKSDFYDALKPHFDENILIKKLEIKKDC